MARTTSTQTSSRLVVLLKRGDKKRLQKLARKENVSSSEIVRRSLHSYSPKASETDAEQVEIKSALAEMSDQLDKALLTLRSARLEVSENVANIRRIRAQHA